MIAIDLINMMIPPLKFSDKASMALSWMEELRVSHLPVVHDLHLQGFISEEMIFDANMADKEIGTFQLIGKECFVSPDKHIYDVIRAGYQHKISMVAVEDQFHKFLGVITMEDTVTAFAQSISIQSQGGIMVLSMYLSDYSLHEISRLIELENAKILSSFISSDPLDAEKIKLTLKINKLELKHIKATLERFGYKVISQFEEESPITNEQDRLNLLMKYLNM